MEQKRKRSDDWAARSRESPPREKTRDKTSVRTTWPSEETSDDRGQQRNRRKSQEPTSTDKIKIQLGGKLDLSRGDVPAKAEPDREKFDRAAKQKMREDASDDRPVSDAPSQIQRSAQKVVEAFAGKLEAISRLTVEESRERKFAPTPPPVQPKLKPELGPPEKYDKPEDDKDYKLNEFGDIDYR